MRIQMRIHSTGSKREDGHHLSLLLLNNEKQECVEMTLT
jgi:hypothetical protein